jgi:multidrug resistance protein
MKPKNPALFVLAFIMFINAIAYGTIIPLLYPYAEKFGIGPFGLGILLASFSLAQFISTPILGRLSDKYGRKNLLLVSLFGTGVSLAVFASATNVAMLFISRIIDGITGGNISIAQAMIADSTKGEERAKSFGLLGAMFGVGFLLGPGLGGLLSTISLSAPFWVASAMAMIGTLLGAVILHETLPKKKRNTKPEPIFKLKAMYQVLLSPLVGPLIVISFLSAMAQNSLYSGFLTFSNDILMLSTLLTSLLFTVIGGINIFSQAIGIRILLNKVKSKALIVTVALLVTAAFTSLLFFANNFPIFLVLSIFYALASAPLLPVVTGLLSEHTKGEDQGVVLGINQSYMSLGQVIGPVLAGLVATEFSIRSVFILSAGLLVVAFIYGQRLRDHELTKYDL